MFIRIIIVLVLIFSFTASGDCREGYDLDSGDSITASEEESVPTEGELDYYDSKDDTFKHDTINSDLDEGEGPIDVYDADSGTSRSINLD